jgi:hypothetical protein
VKSRGLVRIAKTGSSFLLAARRIDSIAIAFNLFSNCNVLWQEQLWW